MLLSQFTEEKIEAGCDEAGRGCLAGPVVAAAVILPKDYQNDILNDSKQLSEKKRDKLREQIKNDAIAWCVAEVSPTEIDKINILNASFLAMHRAVDGLSSKPELLLIDGNRFKPYPEIPHECVVKGDGKFLSIAAASVLAKTRRDEIMREFATKHPGYGWETNAGYPTKAHRNAIRELGTTPHHRMSFKLLPDPTLFD
ncbi:ribonuclease HII [Fulvitalea axinellae]|uniref:Ribonuclease HII n=1 Tax=Fulvitalea axinellae TaxID=1182444 RepID=A0AAU9CMH6_9BACT|nr:ribonuclease HII [Fulvitalea axinellae]